MSCILYSKGAYISLQRNSQLANSLCAEFVGQPLADFLFELNADAYKVRYGHHDSIDAEIANGRADTESDYEFEDVKDWNDPIELFNLFKRIEYQCSDVLTSANPEDPRYLALVAMREDCERRTLHPIYQAEARRKRDAAEAEAAIVKANDKDRIIKELRAQYPWAKTPNASKNLKKELSLAFPGTKFSVRSPHHGLVAVSWDFGPSSDEVDAIANKYEAGSFDGMTDSYNYEHSAYGDAVSAVLGRSTYVQTSRHLPNGFLERVCRDIATLWGVPFVSTYQRRDNDNMGLDDYAYKAMRKVSFPPGAEYVGVKYSDKLSIFGACGHDEVFTIVHTLTDPEVELRAAIKTEFDYIKRQSA